MVLALGKQTDPTPPRRVLYLESLCPSTYDNLAILKLSRRHQIIDTNMVPVSLVSIGENIADRIARLLVFPKRKTSFCVSSSMQKKIDGRNCLPWSILNLGKFEIIFFDFVSTVSQSSGEAIDERVYYYVLCLAPLHLLLL